MLKNERLRLLNYAVYFHFKTDLLAKTRDELNASLQRLNQRVKIITYQRQKKGTLIIDTRSSALSFKIYVK